MAEYEDDDDIDTGDDYELEDDDNAAEEGSVLADSKSIFNSTARDPVNQVVSREAERQNQASAGGALIPASKRQLAAVFGQNGEMQVALVVDGVQKEKFRPPTKPEWEEVKLRGYLVKGGLSAAPEVPGTGFQIPWKPILIGTGLLAAAAGGYWWYTREPDMAVTKRRKRKSRKAREETAEDAGDED
jgi:hypothetical protein